MQVNMHKAKSQLSQLRRLAWEGEEVVIAKAGVPYLRLEPYHKPVANRTPGGLKGEIWVAADFSETDEDVIDSFYQSQIFPHQED